MFIQQIELKNKRKGNIMKKFRIDNGFFLSFLLNLIFNLEWVVLAFILFLLHKFVGLPMWPVWGALAVWFGGVLITTLALFLIDVLGGEIDDAPAGNKNPYSKGASETAATNYTAKPASSSAEPVQYKSELARAIMQPKTYPQPSAPTPKTPPENGEGRE